jgi:hypothetical protein
MQAIKVRGYHVLESMPGYMPDTEPVHFNSLTNARAYMAELARELRDSGYKVYGNKTRGYAAYQRGDEHDLGRVIEIYDCDEAECQNEEDE